MQENNTILFVGIFLSIISNVTTPEISANCCALQLHKYIHCFVTISQILLKNIKTRRETPKKNFEEGHKDKKNNLQNVLSGKYVQLSLLVFLLEC